MTAVSWPTHNSTLCKYSGDFQEHGSYEWEGTNAYKAVISATKFFCPYFQIPKKISRVTGAETGTGCMH